jgi:predicted DNA-binding protein (UPF0251 family)
MEELPQPSSNESSFCKSSNMESPKAKDIFKTKRTYIPIDMDIREDLVRIVEEENITIKQAAQKLKINYSTAKHIVKIYKKTGYVSSQIRIKKQP